jgi:hypothetical protein
MEIFYLLGFFWWIILALGVGDVAQDRGDSFGRWFLVALMVSTPLALLYLIASAIPSLDRRAASGVGGRTHDR